MRASCPAAAAVTLNCELVATGIVPLVAVKVYVPALLTLRPGKVATPATAACVGTPPSVAPLWFAPSATVTLLVNWVAVLPDASRAVTCTAGVIDAPAAVALGGTVNASCVPASGVAADGRPRAGPAGLVHPPRLPVVRHVVAEPRDGGGGGGAVGDRRPRAVRHAAERRTQGVDLDLAPHHVARVRVGDGALEYRR